jgi:hypothetical protein
MTSTLHLSFCRFCVSNLVECTFHDFGIFRRGQCDELLLLPSLRRFIFGNLEDEPLSSAGDDHVLQYLTLPDLETLHPMNEVCTDTLLSFLTRSSSPPRTLVLRHEYPETSSAWEIACVLYPCWPISSYMLQPAIPYRPYLSHCLVHPTCVQIVAYRDSPFPFNLYQVLVFEVCVSGPLRRVIGPPRTDRPVLPHVEYG